MNHYVLTRSAFDPRAWSLESNRRRLEVTRTVTVPLMAAQTKPFTWLVLVDPDDPLQDERIAVFESAGHWVRPIVWRYQGEPQAAKWDRRLARTRLVERIAAMSYKAPWRDYMDARGTLLQTRLDDDDGLAPTAIERYQAASRRVRTRTILMLPNGVRVWQHRFADVTHERNAMHTLVTQPGDTLCIYDYPHAKCHIAAPVRMVDRAWGWLWVRHEDTISGWKRADAPISPDVRQSFPIDWDRLGQVWH